MDVVELLPTPAGRDSGDDFLAILAELERLIKVTNATSWGWKVVHGCVDVEDSDFSWFCCD